MAGLVFLIFFVLLALGYPIIMCMIGGAITPLAMDAVGATSIAALIRGAFSGANSPNILCLPLFIFAGVLMASVYRQIAGYGFLCAVSFLTSCVYIFC